MHIFTNFLYHLQTKFLGLLRAQFGATNLLHSSFQAFYPRLFTGEPLELTWCHQFGQQLLPKSGNPDSLPPQQAIFWVDFGQTVDFRVYHVIQTQKAMTQRNNLRYFGIFLLTECNSIVPQISHVAWAAMIYITFEPSSNLFARSSLTFSTSGKGRSEVDKAATIFNFSQFATFARVECWDNSRFTNIVI